MMKLWLDDVRTPPDETWTWVKSAQEALELFRQPNVVDIASLDHHLGGAPSKPYNYLAASGLQLLWQLRSERLQSKQELFIHTDDSMAGKQMMLVAAQYMTCHVIRRPETRAL